ncbi:cytochrome c oxidase subunit 3 family protein, partial [Streptomyces sp. SID10244]|nr:cytochrome c oxidase subunit 3 family protein [Streptomyces sp. SID10244]
IFGGYFVVFMIYRTMDPEGFLQEQQHLDITIGAINTVILLTSSWFIARAVLATRSERHDQAIRLTYAAGAGGLLFMLLK